MRHMAASNNGKPSDSFAGVSTHKEALNLALRQKSSPLQEDFGA